MLHSIQMLFSQELYLERAKGEREANHHSGGEKKKSNAMNYIVTCFIPFSW